MKDWSGSRVVVVGGAGFVGSNLVLALQRAGAADVVVVDNFISAEVENVPDGARVIRGSIADDAVLAQLPPVDVVFHLATFHGNQSSIARPLDDHANNLVTTLKLYEHLRLHGPPKKIVYAASGCVLAPHTDATPEPVSEEGPFPFDLDSPYQISKIVGELYSVFYHRQFRLPTVRARFQNVYGPREILGAGEWRGTPATVWRNVVPSFVYRALHGEALPLEGGGVASRDFIHVDDIVAGLMACGLRGVDGDVYNLASGVETTIKDLAVKINALTGNATAINELPRRSWDHAGRRVGATDKSERVLGFKARVSLDDGLRDLVAWTRTQLPFIERCIDRHRSRL